MPRGNQTRRQWEDPDPQLTFQTEEKPPEIDEKYEEYLLLLQEKNRIVKKFKQKDPKQRDLEKKEQGFSLYLNGANQDTFSKLKRPNPTQDPKLKSRKTKTAGGGSGHRSERQTDNQLDQLEAVHGEDFRSKTAPEKVVRKNWCNSSVQIKTSRGEKVRVKAPGLLTGEYEDDFEVGESSDSFHRGSYSETDQTDSEIEEESEFSDEGSEIITEDMEQLLKIRGAKDSDLHTEAKRYDRSKAPQPARGDAEQMLLSVKDVKKLRQSLEMNASIRQSLLAQQAGSESDSDHDSPIPEEEEEEEIDDDSLDEGPRGAGFKPNDVIVLEFAPSVKKDVPERKLSAARKAEPESFGAFKGERKKTPNHPPSPREPRSLLSPREEKRERTHTPQGERTRVKKSKELILKPQTVAKKQIRPLSANRKSQGDKMDSTQETQAVLAAMKAENESIERQRKSSRSAPGRSQHEDQSPLPSSNYYSDDRPSSAALSWRERLKATEADGSTSPSPKTPDRGGKAPGFPSSLDHIVQKVLQLDTKGQRKLLKALSQIEDADISTESSPNATIEQEKPRKKKTKKPLKATDPIQKMVRPSSHNDMVDVSVQLVDNWGHPQRIGLTEIQLYDLQNRRVPISPEDVIVHSARHQQGDISNIFNGKTKTVKDRHMWSCDVSPKRPVEISFVVRNHEGAQDFGISKVKLWNYNKSLGELNIGAGDVKIYIDGNLVHDEEIDKGCGNQVFDYSQTINVCQPAVGKERENGSVSFNQPPGPQTPIIDNVDLFRSTEHNTERSQTRLMNHEEDGSSSFNRPELRDSTERRVVIDEATRSTTRKSTSGEKPKESSGEPKSHKHKKTKSRKSKMAANLSGSGSGIGLSVGASGSVSFDQSQDKDMSDGGQYEYEESQSYRSPRKSTSKSAQKIDSESPMSKSKPNAAKLAIPEHVNHAASPNNSDDEGICMLQQLRKQLKEKKKNNGVPSWLDGKDLNSDPLPAPPDSGDQARDQARGQEVDLLKNWPKAGRDELPTVLDNPRPYSGRRSARDKAAQDDRDNPKPGLPLPSCNHDSDLSLDLSCNVDKPLTPMAQIESARNQWRKAEEFRLEESWTNLNLFDRSQKGRISMDLEKDVLDEYLGSEKGKPTEPTIEEQPEPVTEDEDEFTIPELPAGREMVINILSTWGDRHYVGINGIEVFTSSGEMAQVTKITADPPDINILPEYNKDPRVVGNLVDGVNRTRDDTHMWLAPFNKTKNHYISITFSKPINIAMMRIWNYNKSRIHSYRGAKDVEISLDGRPIFKGEISRACGGIMGGTEAFGDTILFTMDEDILELVSQFDQAFEADMLADAEVDEDYERPKTADHNPPSPHVQDN